jgi:hypothetical protein
MARTVSMASAHRVRRRLKCLRRTSRATASAAALRSTRARGARLGNE